MTTQNAMQARRLLLWSYPRMLGMDVCKKVYVCLCLHWFVWKSADDIVQCLCTKDACFLVWGAPNKCLWVAVCTQSEGWE